MNQNALLTEQWLKSELPSRKSEAWRYTDLSPLSRAGLIPASSTAPSELEHVLLAIPAPRIVLYNGFYSKTHSELGTLARGVSIRPLNEVLKDKNSEFYKMLNTEGHSDGVRALSRAFLSDGAAIEIADNVSVEGTIHVINISDSKPGAPILVSPGVAIVMGRASRASIVEVYGHAQTGMCWTNARTAVKLAENASLHHVKIQNESLEAYHVGSCEVVQAKGSNYDSFVFSSGGKVGRSELNVVLNGAEASANLNGLYISREGQLHDSFTVVDHASAHARSAQYYKGVLAEKARAVFNGKIIVRKDSQKTDSSQLNRNLLLGPGAEIDTRPQLQIDADDVKCNHGASIGRPNPEELFYLESRGLSRAQAGHLLCVGFAEDLVQKIYDKRARHEVQNILSEVFSQMKVTAS